MSSVLTTNQQTARSGTGISYEKWIWTELLAFDVEQADFGVSAYLEATGFVPDVISLLIASPDIILQHQGLAEDQILPPDFCSRLGHPGNEMRARQVWTRFQLRDLVCGLQTAGCKVFLSNFADGLQDKFHPEWLTGQPEANITFSSHGRLPSLFVLARLADGSYVRDFFAAQMVRVFLDYGFDGWHGADCFGGHSALTISDCSDDLIAQFIESGQNDLPAIVTDPSHNLPENLTRRIRWIWRHRRLEWIAFYTDQWAAFWTTIVDALHGIGRQAVTNSVWTKDPFEAMYRYGVDYRKIAKTGIDGMLVETCAGAMLLGGADRNYHYDCLAMLLHVSSYIPSVKLIFLHNTKDVVENWDLLRHAPPLLEREIYALSNVYRLDPQGELHRCASGFFVCLGDGISPEEWRWLGDRWGLAFARLPVRALGVQLVWSDAVLHDHLADFPITRDASAHHLTYRLMEHNAPIQVSINIDDIDKSEGPFLILHPHLLPPGERQALLQCGKPLIAIGPDFREWPETPAESVDETSERPMRCRVYNSNLTISSSHERQSPPEAPIAENPLEIEEPLSYRALLKFQPISEKFLSECAELIRRAGDAFAIESVPEEGIPHAEMKIEVMLTELDAKLYRVAVKNSGIVYAYPQVDLGRPIQSITVRSPFPVTKIKFSEGTMKLTIPPRGIVVADVVIQPDWNGFVRFRKQISDQSRDPENL